MNDINGYELSREWFNFCFLNPEIINSNHTALYFFCIEHCNRLGWKKKFGLPTTMAKEAIGIRSYNTYIKTLNDLIDFGVIKLIEKSKNQYSSNIIALSKFDKAHDNALDKALIKHYAKQSESTIQSIDSIVKQVTKNKITIKPITKADKLLLIDFINSLPELKTDAKIDFDIFWNLYDKKVGDKAKCLKRWDNLKIETQNKIIEILPEWKKQFSDKQFQPFPATFLNQERWNDEIIETNSLDGAKTIKQGYSKEIFKELLKTN